MNKLTQAQAQKMVDEMNYRLAWGYSLKSLPYQLIDGGWDTKEVETEDEDYPLGYRFELDLDAVFEEEKDLYEDCPACGEHTMSGGLCMECGHSDEETHEEE